MSVVAGIDIGGTSIKGGVFTPDGSLVCAATVATFGSGRDALESLDTLIRELADASVAAGAPLDAIGVASPGIVEHGRIVYAANLGWEDLALVDHIRNMGPRRVVLDHDARTAAVAELIHARASRPDVDDFVFIPIGTGIAAAIHANGRFLTGGGGGAGEFGHQIVVPGGDLCGCGQRGCVEAYASASNILRRYRQHGGSPEVLSTEDVVDRLPSDPIAAAVWRDAIGALASGIAALTVILDPTVVVLGGGLAQAGATLLDPLTHEIENLLTWRPPPTLLLTKLGPTAGVLGAAVLGGSPATTKFILTARSALSASAPVPNRS